MVDVTSDRYDVAVVGNGPFGSAAARHLAELGEHVCVIGGTQPTGARQPGEMFSSHYDEGRLTRFQDRNTLWAPLTARAIARYRELEERSGITFHSPVGALIVGLQPPGDDLLGRAIETDVAHTLYEPGDDAWRDAFPFLHFPDHAYVMHEPPPAGHINPRRMIAAQNAIATTLGATCIADVVMQLDHDASGVHLTTELGRDVVAGKVLIAAGAFTNHALSHLSVEPLPTRIKTETVVLAEVPGHERERLATAPTVKYVNEHPIVEDLYVVPPVEFPDGKHYVKLGANTVADRYPTDRRDIIDWFERGDTSVALPGLIDVVEDMWHDTEFTAFHPRRCIITYAPRDRPIIDQVADRVFVATAGNGGGAKGADVWGELAAGLAHDGRWPHDVPRLSR